MTDLSSYKAKTPEPGAAIEGRYVSLVPVSADRHARTLFEAGHEPAIMADHWRYMSVGPFDDARHFTDYLIQCQQTTDPLHYALIDRATGRAEGMAAFMRIKPEMGAIEIGSIWFGPAFRRQRRQGTEAIFLMMRHSFRDLGYRRLEWKCNADNAASKRAAERFGFTYEGTFRQHMVIKGLNRDTAWFAMTDAEWPAHEARFDAWLEQTNFDANGRQKMALRSS